jgi:hypothetical protein
MALMTTVRDFLAQKRFAFIGVSRQPRISPGRFFENS